MQERTILKLEQLREYPLLRNTGKFDADIQEPVTTWTEAIKYCSSPIWENCLMMAQNALTTAVYQADWHRGHAWNNLVAEVRPKITEWLETAPSGVLRKPRVAKLIQDSIRWYLMHICLEVEYEDIVKPMFYLPLIDPWLQRGHFPCGWIGQEFPDGWDGRVLPKGKLVVF